MGAPRGNKNAAGPHNGSKKRAARGYRVRRETVKNFPAFFSMPVPKTSTRYITRTNSGRELGSSLTRRKAISMSKSWSKHIKRGGSI